MRKLSVATIIQWSLFLLLTGVVFIQLLIWLRAGLLNPNFGLIHSAYNLLLGIYPATLYALALASAISVFLLSRNAPAGWSFTLFCFCLGSALWGLRYYVTHIEPERLRIHTVEFASANITAPLRIVHISDTHFPYWGTYEKRVIQTLADLDADLIVHSGDFVQALEPAEFDEIWRRFSAALKAMPQPRYGIIGVFGDTDWDIHRLPFAARAPIRFLSSGNELITTHAGLIDLHGLNLSQSRYPEWGQRAIQRWLQKSPDNAFRIALGHAPDFAMAMKAAPIDLILAGHTHGGQVRLPFTGPLVIDSNVPMEWSMGLRQIGVPYLNVSAGAGSNRFEGLPPIRFGCPTELTVFDLIPLK